MTTVSSGARYLLYIPSKKNAGVSTGALQRLAERFGIRNKTARTEITYFGTSFTESVESQIEVNIARSKNAYSMKRAGSAFSRIGSRASNFPGKPMEGFPARWRRG